MDQSTLHPGVPSRREKLAALFDKALQFEFSWPRRALSIAMFGAAAAMGLYGLTYLHWPARGLYWIDHLLFGVGLPFGIYGISASWRLGLTTTIVWSLGNELWEDQLTRPTYSVDWDHLAADLTGVCVATAIHAVFRRWCPTKVDCANEALPASRG